MAPKGNITKIEYDERDRKKDYVQDANLNITTFNYDDNSNLVSQVTIEGTTQYGYDSMNRLLNTTDPKGQIARYTYDFEGQVKTYTDPNGGVYGYTYDYDERLLTMTYPGPTTEVYTYDGVGNVLTFTTRDGRIKTTKYNYFNAPISITWSGTDTGTPTTTIGYSAGRQVASVSNPNCAIAYTYDADNRMLTETPNVGSKISRLAAQKVTYTYTRGDDTLQTLKYPDTTLLNYAYGGRKELTSISQTGVTTPIVSYVYDAANCTSKALGNGVATAYGYDSLERLSHVTDTNGAGLLQSFSYGYDGLSRVTNVKRDGGLGDVFGYDTADQLTGVQYGATNPDTSNPTNPARTVGYIFDSVGNRLQVNDTLAGTINYTSGALTPSLGRARGFFQVGLKNGQTGCGTGCKL